MNPTFQYYRANIKAVNPIGVITLDRLFKAIQNPKPEMLEVYNRIKQAEKDGNMSLKADLKTHLYAVTPSVYVIRGRRYSDIDHFTGLMVLDFDHLASQTYAEEFRDHLFKEHPYIVGAWLSASRLGIRAFVKIPICQSVEDFKSYFFGLANEVMDSYTGHDRQLQNAVQAMFVSHDANIKFRPYEEVETWTGKYIAPPREEFKPSLGYIASLDAPRAERRITGMIRSAINKIVDNGHPQLRGISFTIGGYVATGTVSFSFAESVLFAEIEGNHYLSQKASGYKTTATDMLKRGSTQPLELKD